MFFYPLLRSLLFYFDAELAHRITINLLKTYQIKNSIEHQSLKSNIFGLNFKFLTALPISGHLLNGSSAGYSLG